jgi:hypothetical protein
MWPIMPCSTTSSFVSSTRSCAYITVRITCPPILKPPDHSRASLVKFSPYKVNRIGDRLHPCQMLFQSSQICLPLVQSYLNTDQCTICRQILFRASRYQFLSGFTLIWSSLHGEMPPASLWSKHTILHLCPKFVLILLSATQLRP